MSESTRRGKSSSEQQVLLANSKEAVMCAPSKACPDREPEGNPRDLPIVEEQASSVGAWQGYGDAKWNLDGNRFAGEDDQEESEDVKFELFVGNL
ncbi:hypothetical protein TREES_T100002612 [Tupaia chinensis]|uniref:Uncharacterized protein n=1 Tax=Tupaia chinensis TaxID=246437 RepID=L9L9H0_TUPCH|nr:hypothetical protein TREES_T100002612 [Tupaia chinensis]